MSNDAEDLVITNFENTLSDMKAPYLTSPEQAGGGEKNGNQDVEKVLSGILQRIDELYFIVKQLIDNNGQIPAGAPLHVRTIYQLFEQEGNVFTSMQKNPALKERLLNSLHIILKEYPLTCSARHVHTLKKHAVNSHQAEVIPNTEEQNSNAEIG